METFHFTVVVPDTPDSGELFAALSEHMARYLGLSADEAHQAAGVLNRLVTQRLARTNSPLSITFVRPHETAPVRVEISGRALPDDHPNVSPGGGILVETNGRDSRLTLSWTPRVGA